MTKPLEALIAEMKAAANKAKQANELYLENKITLSECVIETKDYLDFSDNPNNVLSLIAALEQKDKYINELEIICSDAYQAVGALANAAGLFETSEQVSKMMDNLSQLRIVHDDLLPFTIGRTDSKLAVKLPTPATPLDAAVAIRACMDEFPEAVQDIVEECAVIAENTIRAAGGTVQGDE